MVQRDPRCQSFPKNAIAGLLLDWFEKNGRVFPWRKRRKPYEVLIAEVMLQRTKADQVFPVYVKFIERFPDISSLAEASTVEISEYFSRLGLIHRAELVNKLAQDLDKQFCGRVPNTLSELRSLPSVGEYIADAVLCFAFDMDVSVVDSNVCRVIGRVYGLGPKGEARRDPRFKRIMDRLLPAGKARKFNWAVIDLASAVCLPRKPLCSVCPLNVVCKYALAG
jgi:A/G-specific adenine glycosylase